MKTIKNKTPFVSSIKRNSLLTFALQELHLPFSNKKDSLGIKPRPDNSCPHPLQVNANFLNFLIYSNEIKYTSIPEISPAMIIHIKGIIIVGMA
jgi:hypothetical protein